MSLRCGPLARHIYPSLVLIDLSLTVKAATLIFISGHGSAISSAREGKSGSIIIWQRVHKPFWAANVRAFHEILTYTN